MEAARAGAAHAYVYHDKPAARSPAIAAAEQEAKDAQRGLWDPPCYGKHRIRSGLEDRQTGVSLRCPTR